VQIVGLLRLLGFSFHHAPLALTPRGIDEPHLQSHLEAPPPLVHQVLRLVDLEPAFFLRARMRGFQRRQVRLDPFRLLAARSAQCAATQPNSQADREKLALHDAHSMLIT